MWSLHRRYFEVSYILRETRTNWFRDCHPLIEHTMDRFEYSLGVSLKVADWHKLVLEQPSLPDDGDKSRVAYWQSDEKQARDLRTVTSLGKYLKRHFPDMPDHTIRNIVSRSAKHTFEIWDTTDRIVKAVQDGPKSCMQWDNDDTHPYECYDPDLGWAIAVRLQGNTILGRCLIHTERRCFVRSYHRTEVGAGTDGADHGLEDWLQQQQGYAYRSSWPEGVKLAVVEGYDGSDMLPYIDGEGEESRCVRRSGKYWVRDDDGDYIADCTDGTWSERHTTLCDHCDDRCDEDDLTYIQYQEISVCSHCLSCHYAYVTGHRYSSRSTRVTNYWVRDRDVITVDGEDYDEDYLPDYIVELENGNYAHIDNTICVDDEYYSDDDVDSREPGIRFDRSLVCLHDGDYARADDAEWCVYNEDWYLEEDCKRLRNGTYVNEDDYEAYLSDVDEPQLIELVGLEEAERFMKEEDWQGKAAAQLAQENAAQFTAETGQLTLV